MNYSTPSNWFVIPLSFLVGVLLSIYPLSQEINWWRPEFIPLLVIYWVLMLPDRVSVLGIWLVGCLMDVLEGAPIGQHALALLVICYVCLLSSQRMRNYTLWHQLFFVFILVGLYQMISNWVHSLAGGVSQSLAFLLPAVTSALIWPLAWALLEKIRSDYRLA